LSGPHRSQFAKFSPLIDDGGSMQAKNRFLVLLIGAGLVAVAACQTGTVGQGACGAGQQSCGGQCKTVAIDQQNCGTCGNACAAGLSCQNGQCLCSAGLLACGSTCVS